MNNFERLQEWNVTYFWMQILQNIWDTLQGAISSINRSQTPQCPHCCSSPLSFALQTEMYILCYSYHAYSYNQYINQPVLLIKYN